MPENVPDAETDPNSSSTDGERKPTRKKGVQSERYQPAEVVGTKAFEIGLQTVSQEKENLRVEH